MKKISQFKEGINFYKNIEFILNRKKIKNYIIKIDPKFNIVVSIPINSNDLYIEKLLELNIEKFHKIANDKKSLLSFNIKENYFYLFGEKINFKIDNINKKIIFKNLMINFKSVDDIENKIKNYRKKQLKIYLLVKQLQLQKRMNICDHKIFIREKTTAWATNYVQKKTIFYSLNLSSFSQEIIDYVIIHELCHNKFSNHSKQFWQLVEKFEPNFKIKRNKLKKLIYS